MRLTIAIDDGDPRLFGMYFPDLGVLGFTSQAQIDKFVELGGGATADWFVFRGAIPTAMIIGAEITRLVLRIR